MTTILLPIFTDTGAEARARAAIALARHTGGHVACLQVTPLEAYAGADLWAAPLMMSEVVDSIEQREADIRRATEARFADSGISWSYANTAGDLTRAIVAAARLADLIVLARVLRAGGRHAPVPLAGDVAVHASSPVLAVPAELETFDPAGPALVAWNGSAESAAALRAALPLLRAAASVTILTVGEDKVPDLPPEAAIDYLLRHGVRAGHRELPRVGSVGETLCGAFASPGGEWMAMGAYGHSRAREFLLGGVTRHMLEHAPRPVLLAR
jgi:nucleotide-binding universal stress UspA family protein